MKHRILDGKKKLAPAILVAFIMAVIAFICSRNEYAESELIIEKDGKKIYGRLYLPDRGNGRFPLVILGHGYDGSYSDNLDYGRYLSSNGIACYVFDFCGGSEDSKSSGSMEDMSVWTEIEDLDRKSVV